MIAVPGITMIVIEIRCLTSTGTNMFIHDKYIYAPNIFFQIPFCDVCFATNTMGKQEKIGCVARNESISNIKANFVSKFSTNEVLLQVSLLKSLSQ